MVHVKKASEVKEYYEDKSVVKDYSKKRFGDILGSFQHISQIDTVNHHINTTKSAKVLEIACGPARLTKDIFPLEEGVAIDTSEEMLKEARKVMNESNKKNKWRFVKNDAFNLNFKKDEFDLIFTFRFIRHLHLKERVKIYDSIKKFMKPNGVLIFDVVNRRKNVPIRKIIGEKKYAVYDVMYSEKEFKKEMKSNGFKVIDIIPMTKFFFMQWFIAKIFQAIRLRNVGMFFLKFLELLPSNNPLEWIAICKKE